MFDRTKKESARGTHSWRRQKVGFFHFFVQSIPCTGIAIPMIPIIASRPRCRDADPVHMEAEEGGRRRDVCAQCARRAQNRIKAWLLTHILTVFWGGVSTF